MQKHTAKYDRRGLLLSFIFLGMIAIFIFLPNYFRSEAINNDKSNRGLYPKTESHIVGLENYDIRLDKSNKTVKRLIQFREENGKNAFAIADVRANFVVGEKRLRSKVYSLKIEYNKDIKTPEVISSQIIWSEICSFKQFKSKTL